MLLGRFVGVVMGAALCVAGTTAPGHATASDGYLVMFKDGAQVDLAGVYGVRVRQHYDHALRGALISGTAEQARQVAADPSVQAVEQNVTMKRLPTGGVRQQPSPQCGLDRIDQRALPLNGSYTYPPQAGDGVNVYLVDTGIEYGHPDLRPRARPGFDAFGGDGRDENGNGTHMAGIIGGTTFGVAKKAQLISVKVLDAQGGGTLAGVVAGIDWITAHAKRPAVANVVIGIPVSDVLDAAVRNSIASGVTYVQSAGADTLDVDNASPARVRENITVGSSDCADQVASFSNFGQGMDLYAPGVDITSAWLGGTTRAESGTTVSAAHASGVAALYLGRHRRAKPDQVARALDLAAVTGALSGVPTSDTPDKLLQVVR